MNELRIEYGLDKMTGGKPLWTPSNPATRPLLMRRPLFFISREAQKNFPGMPSGTGGFMDGFGKTAGASWTLPNDQGLPEQGEILLHILIEEHHYRIPE